MNIHFDLEILGAILGLVAGVVLVIAVLTKHPKAKSLSFATFFLWAGLDFINAGSAYAGGQPIVLPLAFGTTSLFVAFALVIRGQFEWTWFETLITIGVIICAVVWNTAGATAAFWASITSLFLAGLPQTVEAYKRPETMFRIPWILYWLACVSATSGIFIQGKEDLDQLIYAGMGIFTLGLLILFIYTRPPSKKAE